MHTDDLDTILTACGLHAEAFRDHPSQTIRPPVAAMALPAMDNALTLTRTLGQGGMGEVRLGHQHALDREVAVKLLFPDALPELAVRLVQEARILGRLDHPNVVPVHDMHLRGGLPALVMRRVRGLDWRERMRDSSLEANVDVLIAVCHAVAFAHEKGVVHRDIKPENVMLGTHGEVYLVDWGVAVVMEPTAGLPGPDDPGLAGTPCYMAPEMLSPTRGRIGPASDVYLLGAVLFELLTGAPPNRGRGMRELVESVLHPNRVYPSEAPEELRALAERALSVAADQRPSAERFREDLQAWLRHRASAELAEAAWKRLDDGGSDVVFAFRQALESWPTNPRARAGLERAVTGIVLAELDAGRPDAAAHALAGLSDPPADLVERVERALADARTARDELERYRHADDPGHGLRLRTAMASFALVAWATMPLALMGATELTWRDLAVPLVLLLPVLAAVTWVAPASWTASHSNRRILGTLWGNVSGSIVLHLSCALLGVEPTVSGLLANGVWVAGCVVVAFTGEPRFWLVAALLTLGGLGGAALPEHWAAVHTTANLGTAAVVLHLLWSSRR